MQKIPTIFERDWDGTPSLVTRVPNCPECAWVFNGEGVARQKLDGTACLVQAGILYKREAVVEGRPLPDGFLEVEWQEPKQEGKPRKLIGWTPIGAGPEDQWHREALVGLVLDDGTYELIGPKVQGNPERSERHVLIAHRDATPYVVPRAFDGIRDLLAELDVEGFVFHHEDGRMAKIKARDFGLRRPVGAPANVAATLRA